MYLQAFIINKLSYERNYSPVVIKAIDFFFSFKYFFFTIYQSPEKEILLKPEVYPKVSLEGRGGGIPRERALNPPAANPRAKGWNCIEAPDDTEEAADVEVGNEAKEAVKRFLV